ncbi:MAG TPA: hypothetical protein VF516_14935 [Kofleriaceae bacterium]
MHMVRIHPVLALVAAVLAACQGHATTPPAAPPAPRAVPAAVADPPASPDHLELIRALMHAPEIAFDGAAFPEPRERIRAYVRALLADDATYPGLLSALYAFTRYPMYPSAVPFLVQHTVIDGTPVFYGHYAHDKGATGPASAPPPCPKSAAVKVVPWWDPSTEVLVCPDSYRPNVRMFAKDRDCGTLSDFQLLVATRSPQENICGCGPNLIYCAPNEEIDWKIRGAAQAEFIDTIAYFIKSELPFQDILTTPATMRSRIGDFFYLKSRLLAGEHVDWNELQGDDKAMRPRPWGLGGGVLSTPQVRWFDCADRVVIAHIWEDFLCIAQESNRVDTEILLHGTKTANLRRNLDHLAEVPGCRDCHARMEFGSRFLEFSTGKDDGTTYSPERSPRESRIYGTSADDVLWEGHATSTNLGRVLSQQPQFVDCQVDKVLKRFYGNDPVPSGVRDELRDRFDRSRNFAQLLSDTAVARFAPSAPPPAARAWTEIAEDACDACHDGSDARRKRMPPADRRDAIQAARRVANYAMPPSPGRMDDAERRTLAMGLCQSAGLRAGECTDMLYPFDASADLLPLDTLIERITAQRSGDPSPEFTAILNELKSNFRGELAAAAPDAPPEDSLNVSAYLYLLTNDACAARPDRATCIAKLLDADRRRR